MGTSLNNPEEQRATFFRLGPPPLAGAALPAGREVKALGRILVATGERWALVEGHHHIAAKITLDLHRGLRTDEGRGAVEVILKMNSLLRDPAKLREGENLKSATVGQDGSIPTHEAM